MENKKIKILLVDDDENIRGIYAEVFRQNGFEVEEAADGLEGLDKATKNVPDIIFTGIIMPKMDGFALMENIKKNVATSSIPIIISSHMGREEDREKAMKMGAKDFIVKTMNTPNEIVERIRKIFDSTSYRLKIDSTELDAGRFIKNIGLKEGMKCPACDENVILILEPLNSDDKSFKAKVVCPKCGQI